VRVNQLLRKAVDDGLRVSIINWDFEVQEALFGELQPGGCRVRRPVRRDHSPGRLGWRVPQDLAVVGINDIQFSSYTKPALTSVAQPTRELGALAVRALLGTGRAARGMPPLGGSVVVRCPPPRRPWRPLRQPEPPRMREERCEPRLLTDYFGGLARSSAA
jgi:Periplasmic binding protein-like domain